MTRIFSIYLDATRFLAALAVLLFHASKDRFAGQWLQPLFANAGLDGVVVFFVLSGFVIAYVLDQKEHHPATYLNNRLIRLWSVVLPALLLTFVADAIGRHLDNEIYPTEYPTDYPLARLASAALFLGQLWFLDIQPLSNGPFWSLAYEFWYYLIFGAAVFLRGAWRFVVVGALLAITGPKILILFPIWLFGVWTYRFVSKGGSSPRLGWLLAFTPVALLIAVHLINLRTHAYVRTEALIGSNLFYALRYSSEFVYSGIVGALVAIHFVGVASLGNRIAPLLTRWERPIRAAAEMTFAIYLFHYPLLHLWGAAIQPHGIVGNIAVVVLTVVVIVPLGLLAEHGKDRWRKRRSKAPAS